jgi:alkanesulfonate monooxygenase SsuD/methylene tetrahydromethanopterin reductase-like flavin-dependent oxidoreductase (luciferase family)
VKRIGFLSFGHWTPASYSEVRTASDALLQSIELAVAAEELGLDGAYFRVHHFARQLGSPFPLLAAVGARTKKIEIGTAVIDMRYENPMYMAEDAGAADIIAGGRLQLGISRGSPEQVIDGWRYFGYTPRDGETAADMARRHAEVFLELLKGDGFAQPTDVRESARAAAPRALCRGIAPSDLVGFELERDVHMGRDIGHESPELHAQRR